MALISQKKLIVMGQSDEIDCHKLSNSIKIRKFATIKLTAILNEMVNDWKREIVISDYKLEIVNYN